MAADYVALYRSLLEQSSIADREATRPERQSVLEKEFNGQGPHGDPPRRLENSTTLI
jgi:hypothetical protein